MRFSRQAEAKGVWGFLRDMVGLDARRREMRSTAHRLYLEAVERARQPVHFEAHGVPDTPDGRFLMVSLHVHLILRRLRRIEPDGPAVAQALFDVMLADFDCSVRELGVGDLSVGRYVKRMTGDAYARFGRYDPPLDSADEQGLADAVLADLQALDPDAAPASAAAIGAAIMAQRTALDAVEDQLLISGGSRSSSEAPAQAITGE